MNLAARWGPPILATAVLVMANAACKQARGGAEEKEAFGKLSLNEVEALFPGDLQRFGKGLHAELRSVGTDQADLTSANAIVDAGFVCGDCGITSRC